MKYLTLILLLSGCGLVSPTFSFKEKVKVVCGFYNGITGTIEDENTFIEGFRTKRYMIKYYDDSQYHFDYVDSTCLEKINE